MRQQLPSGILDLMELSDDLVFVLNEDFDFIKVNRFSQTHLGYPPKLLEGTNLFDFIPSKKNKKFRENLLNRTPIHDFPCPFIHKNQDQIPFSWSIKFNADTGFYIGTGKYQEPENVLNGERKKIIQSSRYLINGTQNLIWSVDKNYLLLAANEAMVASFKKQLDFTLHVGQNMLEIPIVNDAYLNKWKALYDQGLSGQTISVEIGPTENKDVDPGWISANIAPIYENSELVGLVCHSTDITEKKNIELQLQKQNELVQNILQHIPMGVAVNDISTGKQVLINQEFSKAYGWPDSELTDVSSFFEKVYPDPKYRKEIQGLINAGIETGDMGKMRWNEIKITTKEGETKYVDAKNIPLPSQDLMISTVMDVTQKVRNKKGIANALKEMHNILESISDAFYALDRSFNFTYVNESALKTMRKSQNDLIGKNLFEEFPQIGKTVFKDYLDHVKKTTEPVQFEFYFEYFDLWFDESIYPSQDGYSIYYKDITKRKLITQALEEAYENESEILESISDAFVAVDREFNFTYFNKKAEKLLRVSKEDALGKNQWDLFDYAKGSVAEQEYNKSIQNKETRTFDYYDEPLNIWLNVRSFPSKNGLSIYFRDITQEKNQQEELKNLNLELKDYTQKLENSNKELEQFAYIASHDLQEPLRMVSSFMTQLKIKYEDQLDDKAQTYINFAVDGAKRMRQIIVDLLEYSRAGTQQEKLEKLDLNNEIAEVLSLLHSSVSKKNIDLEIEELPEVYYSRTAIKQLFHNLIGNAIKYSKLDSQPKIEIKCKECKLHYEFEIKDNGIGIDPKNNEKIFQIFQRLHSKSEYPGTGLGLAICKKLVEKYGGKLWVESLLGIGSSFSFTVPKNFKT
ncbi:PAS domain-containing sensor histidine kinase [Marivirga harenae]|uniref:PAS domain-containing sensor histidine kinase n=1 Tax=Marivirga harenae TaxID=2010992 RepID=UPI0026E09D0B|nr:PAS domain S-box protein [Marivirga harenae]WKV12001.1 PAS domain S-box protein [Marivirga harenae]